MNVIRESFLTLLHRVRTNLFFQLDVNPEMGGAKILINLVIRVYRGKLSKLSRELISLIDRARVNN